MASGKTQTQAALSAYECSSMASAKSIGTQLMKKPDIQIAVAELMQEEGLTKKRYRVQKLRQHVDAVDPNVSLKALDQSWKLDGSYAAEKHVNLDLTWGGIIGNIRRTEEEIKDLKRELAEMEGEEID